MPLPNELRKTAGDLIRSQDWNGLIDGVNGIETTLAAGLEALRAALEARVAGLETGLAALNGEVTTLRNEFDAFRAEVEPLVNQFYRVTLETSKTNYAIGELAELTARVTSLA